MHGRLVDRRLADGLDDVAGAWIHSARAASLKSPTRYGWQSAGRLSAFADEDPFICHSALLNYIEANRERDPMAMRILENVSRQGFESLESLGGASHADAVADVVRARGPGVLPAAAAVGHELLSSGVEIVIVSNSTPEKVLHWFRHAGLPCTEHPGQDPGSLRIRGSAKKFVLGARRRGPLRLGPFEVEVDRPSYEGILLDERPDAIVGDAFSLDIALPLALKRTVPGWEGVRLFWLQHPYTPNWLKQAVETYAGSEVEQVSGGVPGLARLLA